MAPRSQSRRGGQALIEYVLMVAVLSSITLVYVKFYGKEILGGGLASLTGKVAGCISQGGGAGQCR